MKRSPFLILLLCLTPLEGQDNGIDQSSEIATAPTGETLFRWYGKAGRSYFIQVSDSANHLGKWNWAPLIESGNDEIISHDVNGTAETAFFRLKHTDQPLDPGKTLETSDFDSDGLSNIDEIIPPVATIGGATDPLNADTDGDGLSDSFERAHGLDPNDDGSIDPDNGPAGDPDGDGLTNAAELALGTDPSNPDSDEDALRDGEEVILTTDPNNSNTDGDSLPDGEDADPKEILVDWKKVPEASYILLEIDAPLAEGSPKDLNNKGQVLFENGIWSSGEWLPLEIPANIAGSFPTNGGAEQEYYIHFGPNSYRNGFQHFDDSHNLVGFSFIELAGPAEPEFSSVFADLIGQSAEDLAIAELLPEYSSSGYSLGLYGMKSDLTVVAGLRYTIDGSATPTLIHSKLVMFPSGGASPVLRDLPGGARFRSSSYSDTFVTPSGWIACPTQAGTIGQGGGAALWNPQGTTKILPAAAAANFDMIHLTELPIGNAAASGANVGLVVANATGESLVMIPDATVQMQSVDSMSGKQIKMLSADGTGITFDNKLWRNGKLTPLRELCPAIGALIDQGYSLRSLKSNKNGTYLIQASNADDTIHKTMLAVKVEVEQQNYTVANGIRFCRWLDSFYSYGSIKPDAANIDRDRFRIRVPTVPPGVTTIRIKSTGLHGAVIGGAIEAKTTDGDYDVELTEENGAMVSKWILLVSDGDDDKEYNGAGADNGPNDQTLLADFESKIMVTFPELNNAQTEFHAQKAVGKVTLNARYMSASGELPPDKLALILLQAAKAK